ncbi:MAG: hypothetical protein KDA90_08705 [Planctomycetaceae bacterium]|nr:hypothetical protein [Planctomycetaceae bacterium]
MPRRPFIERILDAAIREGLLVVAIQANIPPWIISHGHSIMLDGEGRSAKEINDIFESLCPDFQRSFAGTPMTTAHPKFPEYSITYMRPEGSDEPTLLCVRAIEIPRPE